MGKLLVGIVAVSLTTAVASAIPLFVSSSSRSVPQNVDSQSGAIAGRVLDAYGCPIVGAIVLAEGTDIMIRPTPAWTNKDGEFTIQGLTAGLYTLYTRKDEDGYPHTAFNFYDEGESVELRVQVFAHQTTQNVIIQRGLKAAVLQGVIVDATTNRPLKEAQITVRRIDRPERFLSTGLFWHGVEGGFKFLVPSLAFTLKISALGHEDWYYRVPGETRQASALFLAPNSTKRLLVAMHARRRAK